MGKGGGKASGTFASYSSDLNGNPLYESAPARDGNTAPTHVNVADLLAKPAHKRSKQDWAALREHAKKVGNCLTYI